MKSFIIISVVIVGVLFSSSQEVLGQFNFTIYQCTTNEEVIALVDTVFLSGMSTSSIRNIEFSGDPSSVGYYRNGYFFGFVRGEGIVLSTGFAGDLATSNTCSSYNASSNTLGPSDSDLNMLGNQNITDACIIEFDFMPISDTVSFNYVFGSEEYHEYVETSYYDIMGVFLSGPGIDGDFTNDAINIALIPGTSSPVSINSVNCGNQTQFCTPPPGGNNCQYLYDNTNNSNYTFNRIAIDAYTTPFRGLNEVIPNEWYHIKIAIGDATDWKLDSGVFLEKASFYTGLISGVNNGETDHYENKKTEAFLYPNPAKDQITFGFSSSKMSLHEIIIYDQLGQLVFSTVIDNTKSNDLYTANVGSFLAGLYIAALKTSTGDVYHVSFIVVK
ncbi:MAG: choice-of-anchor L domain-containing protein [Bacteroidota bacterium]